LPARPEPRRRARPAAAALAAALLLVALLATGCGGGDGGTLRLGYFPNLTHGPALVGKEDGIVERQVTAMPTDWVKFTTGTEAVASMLAGSLDASYVGMGPVITTLSRAPGSLRVLSGVSEAGAVLVVRRGAGIRSLRDLRGRNVGFPGFGNTQDLTLRVMLAEVGLTASPRSDGDVRMVRIRNADLPSAFQRGALDAAIAPSPWGEQLVAQGLADVLVPADRIIDGGRYPTTVLVVTDDFMRAHPEAVRQLERANTLAVAAARRSPAAVVDAFEKAVRSSAPTRDVLDASIGTNVFTTEVAPAGTRALLGAAREAGYLRRPVTLADLLPAGDLAATGAPTR
jgi:NitT/TauT family transport system substrate-binding protein